LDGGQSQTLGERELGRLREKAKTWLEGSQNPSSSSPSGGAPRAAFPVLSQAKAKVMQRLKQLSPLIYQAHPEPKQVRINFQRATRKIPQ